MALITWNESYSVGVTEIDAQHQKLIELINQLHEMMRQGQAHEIEGAVLKDLIAYTKNHFSTEEKYFSRFVYPDTEVHKTAHATFTHKVLDFEKRFAAGEKLSIEILHFLSEWLTGHIKIVDKRYTAYFHEHGVQ